MRGRDNLDVFPYKGIQDMWQVIHDFLRQDRYLAFQGVVEAELPQLEHEFSEKDGREADPHTSRVREYIYDSSIQKLTLNMESGIHGILCFSIGAIIHQSILDQRLDSVLTIGRGAERISAPVSTRWTPDVSWRRRDVRPIVYEGVVEVAYTQPEGSLTRDINDWFSVLREGRRTKTVLAVRITHRGTLVFRLYLRQGQGQTHQNVQTVTIRPAQGPDKPSEIDGSAMTIPVVDDHVMVLGRSELTVIAHQTWAEMRECLPYPEMDLPLQLTMVPGFTAAETSSIQFRRSA